MTTINMLSSACKIKGQGVASAYIEQVNLVRTGLPSKFNIIINRRKFADIMHYHTIDLKYYMTIPFAKIKGVTVGYVHFLPQTMEESLKIPKFFKKILYKYIINFYKSMDYLVTVNPEFIDMLASYGVSKDKVTYIPNYVSCEEFFTCNNDKIQKEKEKLNISKDKFVVLSVGQIQTRKGVVDFIDVAKKMPHVEFIWAGGFSFGNITHGYEELKKVVNNPPSNVHFIGIIPRENMNIIYNISDLFFMPSHNELFPMSILEAINVSKPVLLRDLELYNNILFGYYLKDHDIDGFVETIDKLMKDKEYYKEAVKRSLELRDIYSKERVLKMWEEFYDKIYKSIGGNINEKKQI